MRTERAMNIFYSLARLGDAGRMRKYCQKTRGEEAEVLVVRLIELNHENFSL